MALSLYDVSIPAFIQSFKNTAGILEKAKSYAEEKGMPLSKLTEASLIADMKPLTYQIQRMSDTAKGVPVRIAQTESVSMEDNETSFDDLQARIAKTLKVLEKVEAGSMDGKLDMEIKIQAGPRELRFTGQSYVLTFALPNFYFHETTAYAILRHMGVPIGKKDFLGNI